MTRPRRVAVIVVPGVGDDGPGETVDAVARTLVKRAEFDAAERDEVVISPAGDEAAYSAARARLRPAGDAPEVDLYEMRWADLSRFPSGLLRFGFTLYALLLQLATIGLEALRPLRNLDGSPGLRRADGARWILEAFAWVLAVPVLLATGLVGLVTVALYAAVTLQDEPTLRAVALVALALGAVGLGLWGGGRLAGGGYGSSARWIAPVVALGGVVCGAIAVGLYGPRVGTANAALWIAAYPFRVAWLAAAAIAGAAAVALGIMCVGRSGVGAPWRARVRAAYTGLLSLAVAPVGIAVAGAIILASVGALALQTADEHSWGEEVRHLQCLPERSSWEPARCQAVVAEEAREELAGRERTLSSLTPVERRRAEETTRLQTEALALRRTAIAWEGRAREARDEGAVAQAVALQEMADGARGRAAEIARAVGRPAAAVDESPTDWGLRLFGQSLSSLLVAVAVTLGGLALAILLFSGFLLRLAWKRLLAVSGRLGEADRRNVSQREGAAFSDATRFLGRVDGAVAVAAGIVIAGIGVGWAWFEPSDRGSTAARFGAGLALLIAALLLLARVLGVNPFRPTGQTRGALERVRIALDIPYDIATYLRIGHGGDGPPREHMLSRYRALIDHVAGGGAERDPYDALLFVAHSQGTVLTAAALFGDPWRLPAAEPLATACPEITLPPRVSLLTFGSPLLQTYGARFPGQYDWVAAPLAHPDRLRPLTVEWVNVYRAGDYVGRGLWGEGPDEILYDPGHPGVTRTGGGLTIRERCIGDGTHTGYWSDPLWGVHLVRAIRAAAGEPAPWPPEPPG